MQALVIFIVAYCDICMYVIVKINMKCADEICLATCACRLKKNEYAKHHCSKTVEYIN